MAAHTPHTRQRGERGPFRLFTDWLGRARLHPLDTLFTLVVFLAAVLIAGVALVIMIEMALNSRLAFAKFGWSFIVDTTWDPVAESFGALPFIYGTVVSSLIALLLAVPVSLGVAIFLSEQAPAALTPWISFIVQLLAAIPSVVYGLWGIYGLAPLLRDRVYPWLALRFDFLPLFQGNQNGLGMLTAGMILAIMIVPIITAVTTEVLRAVPQTQREAALALGATAWEKTRIVLENARSGIAGAVILGLGRAVGETMAVTMVIGNRPEISASLFAPAYTIASAIANEFTEATSEMHLQALVGLGLLLFVVTFLINALARLLVWSTSRRYGSQNDV